MTDAEGGMTTAEAAVIAATLVLWTIIAGGLLMDVLIRGFCCEWWFDD